MVKAKPPVKITNQKQLAYHSLVPEEHLTKDLSHGWQHRFSKALALIHQDLSQTLKWHEIAHQSAISAYHFHRMFRLVFNETPGQYQSRVRLQWATLMLVDEPGLSVTRIALDSGFSSSQSLAKALKRELGLTAGEIRSRANQPALLEHLLNKLGHPDKNTQETLEFKLARSIPIVALELPQLDLYLLPLKNPSLFATAEAWQKMSPPSGAKLISVTKDSGDVENQLSLDVSVGYESKQRCNYTIAKQSYLCAQVAISSEAGYIAAWDALYGHMLKMGIEPKAEMFGLEILSDASSLLEAVSHIDLYLAIS